MTTLRDKHWTDVLVGGRERRRTIGNWVNYPLVGGGFEPCDPDLEVQSSPPADWGSGAYEFTHGSRRAALQVHVGDSTDAANTALLGLRLSDRPGAWVNFKAINVNPVAMVTDRSSRTVSWPGLWDNATLRWRIGRHNVHKEIVLSGPGHPVAFRFAVRLPSGCTMSIQNDWIAFKDASGAEYLRTRPTWGEDAAGARIRVACVAAPDVTAGGRTLQTFRIIPNATDLATATYPVALDPTTVLSGTTAIQDAQISNAFTSYNYGANIDFRVGFANSTVLRSLIRIATASIPVGAYSAATFNFYQEVSANSVNQFAARAFFVADANTWIEGATVGGTPGVGSGECTWSRCQYSAQRWAGYVTADGCGVSGTDYDANASPPSVTLPPLTSGSDTLRNLSLAPSWLGAWKSGARVNNGFVLISDDEATADKFARCTSTEEASNQPTFSITYSTAGFFLSMLRRRRL